MTKRQLIWLVNKNGAVETEEALLASGYSLEEIYELFESIKEHFEHDGWEDVFPTLRCYKKCAPKYDDMNKMICMQGKECGSFIHDMDCVVNNARVTLSHLKNIMDQCPEGSTYMPNYFALREIIDDYEDKIEYLELLANSFNEMLKNLECYGVIDNKRYSDECVYFADTYLQCKEFLGDNINEMFVDDYGQEQYRYEIGFYKYVPQDEDYVLTDIVTFR